MPIDDIDGKSYKTKMKSSRNYSTNDIKPKSRHYSYLWPWGRTHTKHTRHKHTNVPHKSDFKKPGARRPRGAPGLKTK